MSQPSNLKRFSNCNLILCITLSSLVVSFSLPPIVQSQTPPKKVRLALPTKSVSFLAFYVAHHKGFYRDEGIDLEPILMQPALASTAVLTGDIDYNGAVTGVIGAAVRDRPMKAVLFTVARPLQYLMSKKDIKEPRELKGKKIAGSSPGGTVTFLTVLVLKRLGLDPDRDVFLNPMGGTGAAGWPRWIPASSMRSFWKARIISPRSREGFMSSSSSAIKSNFRRTASAPRRKRSARILTRSSKWSARPCEA